MSQEMSMFLAGIGVGFVIESGILLAIATYLCMLIGAMSSFGTSPPNTSPTRSTCIWLDKLKEVDNESHA